MRFGGNQTRSPASNGSQRVIGRTACARRVFGGKRGRSNRAPIQRRAEILFRQALKRSGRRRRARVKTRGQEWAISEVARAGAIAPFACGCATAISGP